MLIVSAFRSVLRLIGVALVASLTPALLAQSSSPAIDGFDPNVNGNVYAVAIQPDGKIVIAGSFTTLQPNAAAAVVARNNIARLLPNGHTDESFTPNVGGQINSVALQADGKIIIGGRFTTVDSQTRNRVARLNANGTLDAGFNPNIEPQDRTTNPDASLTPEVNVVLVQPDGRVLVGGGFKYVQPTGAAAPIARGRLARFNPDGSLDTAFNPNANSFVLSLAMQPDGKILVGGGFTTLQPNGAAEATERWRIARLNTDGSLDAGFNPKANNAVTAIEWLPNGQIIIGGSFNTLQPNGKTEPYTSKVTRLARLNADGTADETFNGFSNGQVYALKAQPDGLVLIGGSFSAVGDGTPSYMGRILPNGNLDYSFGPGPNFNVYAIGLQPDGSAVLGGGFTSLATRGGNVMVRNHVARVLSTGALDANFHPDANGRLRTLTTLSDGSLLLLGAFNSIGGETHYGIAKLQPNGALDSNFQADIAGGQVTVALQQADGNIVIGGSFTRVNGVGRFNLARLNAATGALDTAFDFAADSIVNAIVQRTDGKLLIGGAFTSVREQGADAGVSRAYIAQINTNGSLDTTFTPSTNAAVNTIALQSDGKILLGGEFTLLAGHGSNTPFNRIRLGRLNANGSLDESFNTNVNNPIYTLFVQSDNKIVVGGDFTQVAPANATTATSRSHLVRLNADGTIDEDFDPNPNGPVYSVAQIDSKLVIGGRFTTLQPDKKEDGTHTRNYVARLEPNGDLDLGFNLDLDTLPGNQVVKVASAADGKILVAGAFTTLYSSNPAALARRDRLVRVNADGSVDGSFDAGLGSAIGAPIESLTVQSDGRLIAAGSFSGFGGTLATNLARFNLDSSPDTSFTPALDGPVHAVAQQLTKGEAVLTPRARFAVLEANGQLRPGFVIETNVDLPTIHTVVVQSDGKLLIGGAGFTTPVGSASLVRLNPNGSLDGTFQPKTNGEIYAIAPLADGDVLVGGSFTKVGDVDRSNIARLNSDGTLDTAFTVNVNASGPVYAIAVQADGRIVLGGGFTTIQPSSTGTTSSRAFAARIAADGTLDAAFDPGFSAAVNAILLRPDGKMLFAGAFTGLRPNGATTTTERAYVAQFNADGTFDSALNLKLNSSANELALDSSNRVLLGGSFTRILDQTRNQLARINPDNTLDAFNPNPNNAIAGITVQPDGKILVAGTFTALQPNSDTYDPALAVPRNRAARLNDDGTIDATFNPNFNSTVIGLIPGSDNTVVAFGTFNALQPTGGLVVGGEFSKVNGIPVNNLALFGRDGSVSATFVPNPNGAVRAILPMTSGQTVVAGSFTTISDTPRNHIARFSATDALDTGFDPNVNGDVLALALQPDGKLVIGGSFTTVGGAARANLARLNSDGSLDGTFAPAIAGEVNNIVVQADGRLLVTHVTGVDTNSLVRLNPNGSADTSFNVANNGKVNALALQVSGHLVVGGSFTSIAGGNRSNLARLNPDGSLDPAFTSTPNGAVTALSIQPDGKILIGGQFNSVDGIARFGIARIATSAAATESITLNAARNAVTWLRGAGAPEINGALFEGSADLVTWTPLGLGSRIGATGNWHLSGITLPNDKPYYVRARGVVPAAPRGSSGAVTAQSQFYASTVATTPAPVITSPTVANAATGSDFNYTIAATGQPTSYYVSNLPAGLVFNPLTGQITGQPTEPGTYTISIYAGNTGGQGVLHLLLFVSAAGENPVGNGKLVNISVNAQVTPSEPIIAGFVIRGTIPQAVLLRAVGPTLGTVGASANPLAEPRLQLFNANNQVVAENAGWADDSLLMATFARVGATPLDAGGKDAALLITLQPGAYTMHVTSVNGGSGTAVAEVYDASADFELTWPRLVNISGRSLVNDTNTTTTGGFVVDGTVARRVLIRGVGPAMAGSVANALADPTVTLYRMNSSGGTVIASNDNWGTPVTADASHPPATPQELADAATKVGVGAFAAGSADAAIIVTLAPGVYTAQVGRAGNATGSTVVEIFELDVP